jgi:hypothetical protein
MKLPSSDKWPKAALLGLAIAYAALCALAISSWIDAHTPCPSIRTGGCSAEKLQSIMLSWVAALAAAVVAAPVAGIASRLPRFKTPILVTAIVLAAPPALFVVRGVVTVFELLSKITYSH